MNWQRLSQCQKDGRDGLFAQALAAFVHKIASNYDLVWENIAWVKQEVRAELMAQGTHKRTATALADLFVGCDVFLWLRAAAALSPMQSILRTSRWPRKR